MLKNSVDDWYYSPKSEEKRKKNQEIKDTIDTLLAELDEELNV